METKDIPDRAPSMWVPETDPYVIAILGKLGEESSELSAKLFRAIIQGLHERDPETGKPNVLAIRDEIADVMSLAENAIDRLSMDPQEIKSRMVRKTVFKRSWFDWLYSRRRAHP